MNDWIAKLPEPEFVARLLARLRAGAPGFDVRLQVVRLGPMPGLTAAALIDAALGVPPLHVQPVAPVQVLRQLHDCLAQEPGFHAEAADAPEGEAGLRALGRQLSRALSASMRKAESVQEFWLEETKAMYDSARYAWEFAYLVVHADGALVFVGHARAYTFLIVRPLGDR